MLGSEFEEEMQLNKMVENSMIYLAIKLWVYLISGSMSHTWVAMCATREISL